MNLSEDDARVMRQQGDLKQFILDGMREGAARNKHRRGMVLAHPDLAAKLTEQPLNFPEPERWTGFIPPATVESGALNTSPIRAALSAIVAEAERRTARQPQQGRAAS